MEQTKSYPPSLKAKVDKINADKLNTTPANLFNQVMQQIIVLSNRLCMMI